MSDNILTIKEAAKILKVHWQTVRNHIKSGDLKHIKIGRNIRIKQSDLDNYIDSKEAEQDLVEIEIRFLLDARKDIENKLIEMGSKITSFNHIIDHWFMANSVKSLSDNDSEYDEAKVAGIRIRETDNDYSGNVVTSIEAKKLAKLHDHTTCIESVLYVKDYDEAKAFLNLINLKEVITIDKSRTVYQVDECMIVIDEIIGFGTVLELEVLKNKDFELEKDKLRKFAQSLGIDTSREIKKSATHMAMQKLARF